MKNPFNIGDVKIYEKTISSDETARFDSGEVHPFYGTFALGRDAEWVCRLFVLEMKEHGEEGIGTYLNIKHISPGRVGEKVLLEAVLENVEGPNVHCSFTAKINGRLIAKGSTGQMILDADKLKQLYQKPDGE